MICVKYGAHNIDLDQQSTLKTKKELQQFPQFAKNKLIISRIYTNVHELLKSYADHQIK